MLQMSAWAVNVIYATNLRAPLGGVLQRNDLLILLTALLNLHHELPWCQESIGQPSHIAVHFISHRYYNSLHARLCAASAVWYAAMSARELLATTAACLLLAVISRGSCSGEESAPSEALVFGTVLDRDKDGTCVLGIEHSLHGDLERVPPECWVSETSTDRSQLRVQCTDADFMDWSTGGVPSVYALKLAPGSCPGFALQSPNMQHRWLVRRQSFDREQWFQFCGMWG